MIQNHRFKISLLFSGLIVAILMVQFHYVARETDSRLYTRFVKQLSTKPLGEFVAPRWAGMSTFAEKETPFVRDHLPGQYFLPVLLTKLGVPASHAHYIVNTFVRLIILYLFFKLALLLLPLNQAILVPLCVQLMPINFTYQLRSNHEYPMLMFSLIGIWGLTFFNKDRRKSYLMIALAVLGSYYIKGLAMVPLIPLFWIAMIIQTKKDEWPKLTVIYTGIVLLIPLTSVFFEFYFRSVTGVPFFKKYFEVQIYKRSIEASSSAFNIIKKFQNFWYYFSRTLSYTLPFSLAGIIFAIKNRTKLKEFVSTPVVQGLLLLTFINVAFFSMSDRTASRYIFSSYYSFAALSIIMVLKYTKLSIKKINLGYVLVCLIFVGLSFASIYTSQDNVLKYPN